MKTSGVCYALAALLAAMAFSHANPPFYGNDERWQFELTQWLVTAGAVWLARESGNWRRAAFIVLALVFNPFRSIHFEGRWSEVEGMTALALVAIAPATKALALRVVGSISAQSTTQEKP